MGVLAIVRVPSTRGWDEETGADVLTALAGRPPTGAVAWPKRRNPTPHSPAGRGRRARNLPARCLRARADLSARAHRTALTYGWVFKNGIK